VAVEYGDRRRRLDARCRMVVGPVWVLGHLLGKQSRSPRL
jgi:hypothetical protein